MPRIIRKLTGVSWWKSAIFCSWETYGKSVSSGLSVAVPKYNFPAAWARVFNWATEKETFNSSVAIIAAVFAMLRKGLSIAGDSIE